MVVMNGEILLTIIPNYCIIMLTEQQLLEIGKETVYIAKKTGSQLYAYYNSDVDQSSSIETFKKEGNSADIVTKLDKSIELEIKTYLNEKFPFIEFIGEETGVPTTGLNNKKDKYYWIVDPIDGTTNFVHKYPHSCISIALVHNGDPLLGIVYHPIYDKLYFAIKGKGAYLNSNKRLKVSNILKLNEALVCTEFGNSEWRNVGLSSILNKQREKLCLIPAQGIRCLGSAALNICLVASGELDLYYQYGIHAWDIAAGVLILTEAGGCLSSLFATEGKFNLSERNICVCASPELQAEFYKSIIEPNFVDPVNFEADPF